MNNLNSLSIRRKIIITSSVAWTVISFILSLYITKDSDEGYFLSNFLTFLTSFLVLATPSWLYWVTFWIWGDDSFLNKCISRFTASLFEQIRGFRKRSSWILSFMFLLTWALSLILLITFFVKIISFICRLF